MLTAETEPQAKNRIRWALDPQITVQQFQEFVNQVLAQPGLSPATVAGLRALAWMFEVDAFRALELKMLKEGTHDKALDSHRTLMAGLIGVGEDVVLEAQKSGLYDGFTFTFGDLRATLNALHTSFRSEHGPKNSVKTDEALKSLFDGEKS